MAPEKSLSLPNLEAMASAMKALAVGGRKPEPVVQSFAELNQKAFPEVGLRYARSEGPEGAFASAFIDNVLDALFSYAKAQNEEITKEQVLLGLFSSHGPAQVAVAEGYADGLKKKPKEVVQERQRLARAILAELGHRIWHSISIEAGLSMFGRNLDPIFGGATKAGEAHWQKTLDFVETREAARELLQEVRHAVENGLELTSTEKAVLIKTEELTEKDPKKALSTLETFVARAREHEKKAGPSKRLKSLPVQELKSLKTQVRKEGPEPKPPVWTSPEKAQARVLSLVEAVENEASPTEIERFEGATIGLAVGDVLGGPLEFMSREQIAEMYGFVTEMLGGGWLDLRIGEYTDDTQMAERMGDSIVAKKAYDSEDVKARYVDWLNTKPKDVGGLTRLALQLAAGGIPAEQSGHFAWILTGYDNAGNGSLMRAAPNALVTAFGSEDEIVKTAFESSQVTHGDPRCLYGTAALSLAVSMLVKGETNVLEKVTEWLKPRNPELAKALADVPKMSLHEVRASGFVVHTLQAAFWALHHAPSFPEGILALINLGEDTDTAGATAGILLGAKFGVRGIPEEWRKQIENKEKLLQMARDIHELAKN